MAQFQGSIAQVNVNFPIETLVEPIAGEQYSRAVIFMDVALAAENLAGVTSPTAGQKVELDSSGYATIVSGGLLGWVTPFFTLAQTAKLAIVLYDTDREETVTVEPQDTQDSQDETETEPATPTTEIRTISATCPLSQAYELYKTWGYFKFLYTTLDQYVTLQVALGTLCNPDPLYSAFWVGTSDTNILTEQGSALITSLKNEKINARVVYNPDSTINAALAQLGDSLATVNSTGTPIGNDTDYHAFAGIGASGSLVNNERTNLTSTEKAKLDELHVGYNTWVGDGTENVVTEGSLTLQGESVGANWVKHYIEYRCKVLCANYLTRRNIYRNNTAYQAILTIPASEAKQFVDLGRLADFVITAPPFKQLSKSADSFTVANAWQAYYVDKARYVTVYGTLYVTQASR